MLRRSLQRGTFMSLILTFGLIALGSVVFGVNVEATGRTYTTDADFDEGTLVGVEVVGTGVPARLQLSKVTTTLPFIWVPNTDGTVSKVNTETGKELGRYWVAPHNGDPSRTTVDLQGNCWVGNRTAGTVVKIGLYEAGQYIDRNDNGTIETSKDLNDDGDITGGEILPWGQDECVLYEVVLISGKEGTFVPGTYAGGYDTNYWGTSPRGLAIDASNNLWAGTWSSSKYYYIDGSTGTILNTIDVSPWGHSAYGAVIDQNGILWSARLSSHVLRIDPSNLANTIKINLEHTYGLGLDYLGHLFVGGGGQLTKIDINNTVTPIMWTKPARTVRGVVCTADNDVWVAGVDGGGVYNSVSRYDNNGNFVVTIPAFNAPSGVAVDAVGKVWGTNINDSFIHRIDPATNTVDLSKSINGSPGHYTYSDMTGIVSRTITTKIGTWTVDYDSGKEETPWGTISWNNEPEGSEPPGTSITVKVRSSNNKMTWSVWETASNGVALSLTPDGRYLQIEATLQIISGDVSPILSDLTVEPAVITVEIDIKPGSWPNAINPDSKGVIPVAILTTDDFDATTVDPLSVKFGVGEATECHGQGHIEDVDGDGDLDMVLHFKTQDTGIKAGDTEACLTGETVDGQAIEGCDAIMTVPKGKGKPAPALLTFSLGTSYPNPTNPEAWIPYKLGKDVEVTISIYSSSGRIIRTLQLGHQTAGAYISRDKAAYWNGRNDIGEKVSSGVYFYTLKAGDFIATRKMVVVR